MLSSNDAVSCWGVDNVRSDRLRTIGLILAVFAMIGATRAMVTAGQATLPGPATISQAAFPVTVSGSAYELINLVLEFTPGSGVPKHFHGGPVLVTVLSGEITLLESGRERVIKAGESWREQPGEVHAVINRSSRPTRVTVSILLPKGAAATTLVK